jgi:hypothetical protein
LEVAGRRFGHWSLAFVGLVLIHSEAFSIGAANQTVPSHNPP